MTIEMMKKVLSWGLLTIVYLLVLGQGCSALKDQSDVVTLKLPLVKPVVKKTLPKIALKKAPESKNLLEKQAKKMDKENTLLSLIERAPRKQLELKPKASQRKVTPKKKYEKLAYAKPLKKAYTIVEAAENIDGEEKLEKISDHQISLSENKSSQKQLLNNKLPVEHYGFEVASEVEVVAWSNAYPADLEQRLLALNNIDEKTDESLANSNNEVRVEDEVGTELASASNYNPSDPKMLEMFQPQEITIEPIKKEEEKSTQSDELVMIDYQNQDQENIHDVAKVSLSSEVRKVIQREMGSQNIVKPITTQAKPQQSWKDVLASKLGTDTKPRDMEQRNRVSLFAMSAAINKGIEGQVNNFSFMPTYDDTKVYEDFNEGRINFDYSLNGNSGVLRGSIAKTYYMRTTFEIPLGSEYSKFEIPMITQESMYNYLESNSLDGYGGYYLVDLGEYIEDVEIEKSGARGQVYQHRLLLNENFVKAKDNETIQYILFIGVEPGNINTRYLGLNGQETSKITFIAPDEITYDFSQMVAPSEYKIETYIRHTLGRDEKPLPLESGKITGFLTGEHPEQILPGEYKFSTPWLIKGSRSYLEFNHLGDAIFVGIDGDKKVTVPSREFIGEVLKAFQMDGLNQECLVQINLEKEIKDIKVFGESDRGPSVYDTAYLDKEGVFSAGISNISEKLFLLGNEEGIFNVRVDYADNTQDVLRTYCSPSTYLLEQL